MSIKNALEPYVNPVICADFPDPDIIRVDDTYYMASTTMYFMPGGDLLRSRDLVHWEFAGHVFDKLEDSPAHRLENGRQIYGQGMWAPSLRFHNGVFYLTFSCNDTRKSLLFQASDPTGPWRRTEMGGFFYDASLFFDDDGRVYIAHGNTALRITELETETWGPKPGGLDRIVVTDSPDQRLGYEGSHLYKHNGRYYLFTCHMPRNSRCRKTQDCFLSDALTGTFRKKTILDEDLNWRGYGIAQGGMVDTPDDRWYAFLFQDRGALGRTPVLFPMTFDREGFPVLDTGKPEAVFSSEPTAPLHGSDSFSYAPGESGCARLATFWQFSHNPDPAGWSVTAHPGAFRLTPRSISPNLILARNTLTQRCAGPRSAAWVTVDGRGMHNGDCAGICAYQGCYGAIALTRRENAYQLIMMGRPERDRSDQGETDYEKPPVEYAAVPAKSVVTLRADVEFSQKRDVAAFSYLDESGRWKPLGIIQRLYFKLDLFTGCRFGLFCYATEAPGGSADFLDFHFQAPQGETDIKEE